MQNIFKRLFIVFLLISFVTLSIILGSLLLDSYPIKNIYEVTCNWNNQSFATSTINNYDLKPKVDSWSYELKVLVAGKCLSIAYQKNSNIPKIEKNEFETKWPEGFTIKKALELGGIPIKLDYYSAKEYINQINNVLNIDLNRDDAFTIVQKNIIWISVFSFIWRLVGLIIILAILHLLIFLVARYIFTGHIKIKI